MWRGWGLVLLQLSGLSKSQKVSYNDLKQKHVVVCISALTFQISKMILMQLSHDGPCCLLDLMLSFKINSSFPLYMSTCPEL